MQASPVIPRTTRIPRLAIMLCVLVTLFAVGRLCGTMWQHRTALITADPYSYISFAQDISEGNLFMSGPVADAVAAFSEAEELAPGPVWNTTVLPDGRIAYTIAIGYPLALASSLWIGGIWLCTHLNVFVLLLVVVLLCLLVWLGFERSFPALGAGCIAAVLFIHSHPATFLQFSLPWREPVFYACILGAVLCLVRFSDTRRLGLCAGAGLLLGYACAIKEANLIYALWLALCLVSTKAFRAHPSKGKVVAVFVAAGVVGILPLLIQNTLATGNPLLSLQFMRATGNYSLTEAGHGLATGNTASTFSRYIGLYLADDMIWFRVPFLLVAACGVICSLRYPVGRMTGGLLAAHLVLYLQWGNADYRHMFFAHLFYAVFVGVGSVGIIRWLASALRISEPHRDLIVMLPVITIALWPSPWSKPSVTPRFRYADAVRLADELEESIGRDSVLLSNRTLRDVLSVYGNFETIRLHDVAMVHPDHDMQPVLEWFMDNGVDVYFLDNVDLDPTNVGRVNWTEKDRQWLLQDFDLDPALTVARDASNLGIFLNRDTLQIDRVRRWQVTEVRRDLPVPAGGAAFLFLHPRAAGADLSVQVDGQSVPFDATTGFFIPVDHLALQDSALLVCRMDGRPVPSLRDAALIGWDAEIRLPCGTDASPPDGPMFPDGGYSSYDAGYRILTPPTTIRLPIRSRPDLFTTIGLGMNIEDDETGIRVFVDTGDGREQAIGVSGLAAWFPIRAEGVGASDVRIRVEPDTQIKLNRAKSLATHRTLTFVPTDDVIGVGLRGMLAPERMGEGTHAWTARVNGKPGWTGDCSSDPRRSANDFGHVFETGGSGRTCVVEFTGAGLIDPRWIPVRSHVEIAPDDDTTVFLQDGFYPRETNRGAPFMWTKVRAVIKVPVTSGTRDYRLVLEAADGSPRGERLVRVTCGGHSDTIHLPQARGTITLGVQIDATESGLADLVLEIAPWLPGEEAIDDPRSLGFLFYRLTWEPAEGRFEPR